MPDLRRRRDGTSIAIPQSKVFQRCMQIALNRKRRGIFEVALLTTSPQTCVS